MARLFDPVTLLYIRVSGLSKTSHALLRGVNQALQQWASHSRMQPANQLVSGMSSYNTVRLYHVWLQIQVMSLSKSTHSYVTPHFYFVLFETLNFIFKLNVA